MYYNTPLIVNEIYNETDRHDITEILLKATLNRCDPIFS